MSGQSSFPPGGEVPAVPPLPPQFGAAEANPYQPPTSDWATPPVAPKNQAAPTVAVPWWAHVLCAWPFLLVLVGGILGGIFGGVSYVFAVQLFRTNLSMPVKVIGAMAICVVGVALFFGLLIAVLLIA
jgi:hypothetical protein